MPAAAPQQVQVDLGYRQVSSVDLHHVVCFRCGVGGPGMMDPSDWSPVLNNLLNVVQVVVLAYIAARYRSGPNGGGGKPTQ